MYINKMTVKYSERETKFKHIYHTSVSADRAKTAPSMIKPLIKAPSEKQSPGEGVEMAVPGQKPSAQDDGPPKPKLPSKDAPLRWGALTVFLVVNIVMMLVLIILIAIE